MPASLTAMPPGAGFFSTTPRAFLVRGLRRRFSPRAASEHHQIQAIIRAHALFYHRAGLVCGGLRTLARGVGLLRVGEDQVLDEVSSDGLVEAGRLEGRGA